MSPLLKVLLWAALPVAVCVWAVAHGQGTRVYPDPSLTPGAIRTISRDDVCSRGYDRAHRVWTDEADTRVKYGYSPRDGAAGEDDDLFAVCMGGDNANPLNHWIEPWPQARRDDDLEAELCHRMCMPGSKFSVEDAQGYLYQVKTGHERP